MTRCEICLADHEGDDGAVLCEDCCLAGMHLFMQEALCARPMPGHTMSPGQLFTSTIAHVSVFKGMILHMRERLLRCRLKHAQDHGREFCPDCGMGPVGV